MLSQKDFVWEFSVVSVGSTAGFAFAWNGFAERWEEGETVFRGKFALSRNWSGSASVAERVSFRIAEVVEMREIFENPDSDFVVLAEKFSASPWIWPFSQWKFLAAVRSGPFPKIGSENNG